MQTRHLGNSELEITPIGTGAWAMGGRRLGFLLGTSRGAGLFRSPSPHATSTSRRIRLQSQTEEVTPSRKQSFYLAQRFGEAQPSGYCRSQGMLKCVLPGMISRSREAGAIASWPVLAWVQLR